MKKLMFATALTASAVAFGATDGTPPPFNAISFEGYDLSQHAITNGMEITEDSSESIPTYFFYTNTAAGAEDSSYVTKYPDGEAPSVRTKYFKDAANTKYLALDTEGGTLWRSLATPSASDLGTAQTIGSDGIYIDTLVQFTFTEDEVPSLETGDRLAICLGTNGVEATTNLLVKAVVVDDQGARTETLFTVTNVTVNAGSWYRLTVKAFADITDGEGIPGFQIFIDGNVVSSDTPTLTTEYLGLLGSDSHYDDIVLGKYFASKETTAELQGVGFRGTGAIDDLVLTTDPETLEDDSGIEFTLTWDPNLLSSVSYVLSTDMSTTNSVANGTPFTIPAGAESTFIWNAAPGYTFAGGQTTHTQSITVGTGNLEDDVESLLSKVTFTVTVADIENVTVAATTNAVTVEPVVVNSLTNQYTVETNDTITVTVTPSKGYAYTENTMAFITGDWTLNVNGTISTNVTVTEAITLEVPDPDSRPYELDVSYDSSKTTVDTLVNGSPSFNGVCIGDTIVITSAPEDGYEYASLPGGWEWDPENAGTIKTNITVDAAFIDTAEGNVASSDYFFGEYTITVPNPTPVSAPSGIEIEAGGQGSDTYADAAEAAAVTNSVTIAVSPAVSNALETAGVNEATYKSLFEPKVVSVAGGYKIEIGLTAAAEAGLQTQVNTDAGTLAGTLTTDGSSASVTTTPGLYYAIKYGLSLDAMDYNTVGVLAEDTETSLPVPVKDQTAAFYKVIVSPTPIPAVTE